MPVLTMGGERSQGAAVETSVRPLARHVRGVVIERSGPYIPKEWPDVTAGELLRSFEEKT